MGRMRENEAKVLLYSLLRAVQYCHDHHIAHLDICTYTIFVQLPCHEIKLACFDQAIYCPQKNTVRTLTTFDHVVFAAPELIDKQSMTFNPFLADMWSLGVLLFTLLAGNPPFIIAVDNDQSRFDLLFSQTWRDWHLPASVDCTLSWSCHSLIWSLLEPVPAFRRSLHQSLNSLWFAEINEKDEEEAEEEAADEEESDDEDEASAENKK